MRIIKIEAEANGGHAYQTIDRLGKLPSGWAVIPMVTEYEKTEEGIKVESKEMDLPNLPYGDLTVEIKCGVPTVTSWTPGEIPPMPDIEPVSDEVTWDLLAEAYNEGVNSIDE